MKKAILYVIVFAAIQMGASSIVMALWKIITGSADVTAPMLIVSMTLFSVGVLAVFLLAKWCVLSPNYLRMRQWGVFIWCVLAALGAIIPSIWFQEQMPELPNILGDEFDMILRNPFGDAVVGLLAPFVEELVFRGAILRSLLEWTKRQWVAIAISALLFALIHGNPAQMPHAFIIGLQGLGSLGEDDDSAYRAVETMRQSHEDLPGFGIPHRDECLECLRQRFV